MTSRYPQQFWTARPDRAQENSIEQLSFTQTDESPQRCRPSTDQHSRWDTATNRTADEFGSPLTLFVPENYEPNYPYPLFIWLHGAGGSEQEIRPLMRRISPQNYLGLAFRGTLPSKTYPPVGFRWSFSATAVESFKQKLCTAVCQLRRDYHVHSERIFLAGFDEGATLALQLLLDHPDWFAGAIALNGRFPDTHNPLIRFRDLTGKRVFLGTGTRDRLVPPGEVVRIGRLLHSAGMRVSTQTAAAAHEIGPEMLSHINDWLMQGICAGD